MKTYVFISGAGIRGVLGRGVPYSKMKIGVEDTIAELGFENVVVLRPGLILNRERPKARVLEEFVMGLGRWVGLGVQDWFGMLYFFCLLGCEIGLCFACLVGCWFWLIYVQARIRLSSGELLLLLRSWRRRERRRRSIGLWKRLILFGLGGMSGRNDIFYLIKW